MHYLHSNDILCAICICLERYIENQYLIASGRMYIVQCNTYIKTYTFVPVCIAGLTSTTISYYFTKSLRWISKL